jgi:ABC-type amino acid transport system permease subunit
VAAVQPPLVSELILCVKNTSLGSLVGLDDLLRRGEIVYQRYVNPMETLAVVGAFYWLVCFTLSQISRRLEGEPGATVLRPRDQIAI